jgi:hypothetical protein
MTNRVPIFVALIAGILLTCSCKKDSPKGNPTPPPPPAIPGPFLYLGGSTDSKAVYWKLSLSQPSDSVTTDTVQNATNISSIVISDNTRYMVGGSAGYWKNDSFVAILSASQLNLLAVSGTTVYTAGTDISVTVAQWTNSTESANLDKGLEAIFPRVDWNFLLTGIAVSGPEVLVSGSWVVEGIYGGHDSSIFSGFGVLFTNGSAQLLPYNNYTLFGGNLFPWTNGVTVSGNDIYVPGTLPDTIPVPNGGFWKNSVWNNINNGQFHPSAIASADTNVVITGYTYTLPWNPSSMQGAYWHNGTLTHLNGTSAVMVALYGNDVYVLGQDNNNNIVVWKNGALFKTLSGVITGNISCMTVGDL